ncbi:hypothetical protein DOK78_002195 [Enterococcus sp. DIV2402]|uniref:Aminoglycoside phosphotransferase domain-containing protein n=1 Tax=Candidatus Enterococcus lowellii TaxID=2230877 RepID=A0ABZ2SPT8_9ENTE|nr:aminoglycoside phosphotransferase family protein [Enterococcus sp. DIV2402]MBO0463680.1 aminoglycoside phosphotransferase family protein [Enterococcus sp. DIV2402]
MFNIARIFERHQLFITDYYEISSGFSNTKKYLLTSGDKKYLLKIYPLAKFERLQQQQVFLKQHQKNHVHCQTPIFYDTFEREQLCYFIFNYLSGITLAELLPTVTRTKQYELGIQAGRELKKIHLLPSPEFDWYQTRYQKYQLKKKQCAALNLHFYHQKEIETFIEENFYLLKNSTICFQHDDFHPQNLLYHQQKVFVLDFDSFDWGDPWEEFFKLPKYTTPVSVAFAKGQLIGYFDGHIPQNFWKKYHLFVALNCHASQLGGYHFGNCVAVQERTKYIIQTHSFSDDPPAWFQRNNTN